MYDLQLTAEQLEFRDAVRDFVTREVQPAAIDPKRLEPFEKPLMTELLDQLSQMGLRGLAMPEVAGGAGADLLTCCVLLEEIAAGDVDLAMILHHNRPVPQQWRRWRARHRRQAAILSLRPRALRILATVANSGLPSGDSAL